MRSRVLYLINMILTMSAEIRQKKSGVVVIQADLSRHSGTFSNGVVSREQTL